MRIALVVLFLLCGVGVFAESRQTPSENQNTAQNKESAKYHQQPDEISEQRPLFIKIIPPPKSDKEAKTEESERAHKTNVELWTVGTSIATAIILVLQLFVFGRQARRLRETVEATEKAAEAGKKQTEVSIKEFVSTHRPKVIVRSVTIEPPSHPALPIEEGKPLKIQGAVVNIGDTPTEIIESNITILVAGPTFYARTPFGPAENNINGVKLVPGGAYTFWATAEQIDFKNTPEIISLRRGEKVIYFFGFISYRDDIGNMRRTAFCRKYNPETERFDQTSDPDYEYAD